MYPFNRHERLRKNLSTYIDGELSPRDTTSLETHLAGCESCQAELDDLRAGKYALNALPSAEVPRSFALTPEMVAGPQPAPQRTTSPALNTGLRLAAGGLALALAVVAFADNADFRGGDESAQESQTQDGGDAAFDFGATAESVPEGANRSTLEDPASDGDSSQTQPADATISGGVGGSAPEATSAPPAAGPDIASPQASPSDEDTGDAVAQPLPEEMESAEADEADNEKAAAEAADESDDEGVDAYTLIEVVLAALLALVVGVLLWTWIGQRRRSV
jgi:hypothetical protein